MLPVPVRRTEVPPHNAAQVAQKLLRHWLVEGVCRPHVGLDGRRQHALFIERSTRGRMHQQKCQHNDQQQSRDRAKQPLQYVLSQSVSEFLHMAPLRRVETLTRRVGQRLRLLFCMLGDFALLALNIARIARLHLEL